MFYVKITHKGEIKQFPYTLRQLRIDESPTTFPKDIPDSMLAEKNVYPVTHTARPTHDELTQFLARDLAPSLIDGAWVIGYTVENIPIEDVRAEMSCTKMQGVLTLGEANWSKVMAFYTTDATWVQKAIIDSAANWRRTSDDLKFIGYLIGFDDEQMDAMFAAALVEA
jgi:hypothetical protein